MTQNQEGKGAQPATAAANAAVLGQLAFGDRQDFADASRGLVAAAPADAVLGKGGFPIWDMAAYGFEDAEEVPATVNPSLWRQAQLNKVAGLFEVTGRVYQLRGLDISNLSVIEGDTGVIIIDPFISAEMAERGMRLYREHRGDRPVVGPKDRCSSLRTGGGWTGTAPPGSSAGSPAAPRSPKTSALTR